MKSTIIAILKGHFNKLVKDQWIDVTKLKSETAMGDESEQGFVIDKTTGKIREFGGQRQPEGLANPEIEEAQANMQAFFNANPREAQDDPAALERAFWSWYNNRER